MNNKKWLDPEQKQKLQKALKNENNRIIRQKILIILLINDGKNQREVAEFLGCSLRTVNSCYREVIIHGVESLLCREKLSEVVYIQENFSSIFQEMLQQSPQSFGYEESEWARELMQIYLESKLKTNFSSTQWQAIWKLLEIDK